MEAGQTVYIVGGGYYEVVSVVSNSAVLKNLYDEPANAAAGATVNGTGTALSIVGGARGRGAYTYLTANFTQPASNATVVVAVADTTVFVADSYVFVSGGGVYKIDSIASGVSMTLRNTGAPGNAAPAATVTSGAKVVASGAPSVNIRVVNSYSSTPVAITSANDVVIVDATAAPATVNLPTAASVVGLQLDIKKVDATNNVTVQANGAETIDGSNTATLTSQYESITIVSDGTEWHIL
jgi:hypothetical protein